MYDTSTELNRMYDTSIERTTGILYRDICPGMLVASPGESRYRKTRTSQLYNAGVRTPTNLLYLAQSNWLYIVFWSSYYVQRQRA